MQDKRYSVFISSTFNDLREERRAVQDVVISSGDFPVQMESFPAADEDQFEFIKSLIEKCDYYVLIVAGRYGTASEDGLSYTEKEYHHAVLKGIPVSVMLHGDRGAISADKSEESIDGKKRLAAFVAKVEKNRLRKTWETSDALKLAVREALEYAKATKPAVGWVRGDSVASVEALEELNEIRKENARFREAIGSLEIEIALPPIPAANDETIIELLPNPAGRAYGSNYGGAATVQTTWIEAFPIFFNNLRWAVSDWDGEESYYIKEDESCIEIGSTIAGMAASIDTSKAFRINKSTLDRFISYFVETGLMNVVGAERPFTETAQRVARRHNIAGGNSLRFRTIKGEISLTPSASYKLGSDDEVPF